MNQQTKETVIAHLRELVEVIRAEAEQRMADIQIAIEVIEKTPSKDEAKPTIPGTIP